MNGWVAKKKKELQLKKVKLYLNSMYGKYAIKEKRKNKMN
jgi:hypothetical protein